MKNLIFIIMQFYLFLSFHSCENINNNQSTKQVQISNLVFKSKVADFGNVPTDTLLKADYSFTNTGINEIIIEYINVDCICTDYKVSSKKIAPHEQAVISLFFDTKDKIGQQKVIAVIKTNTHDKFHRLLLKANVQNLL